MMVIVLLGACILVQVFFNIMLGVEDYGSDVNLLMTTGHHFTKIYMVLTIVLGVLILKSKYFC